MPNPAANPDPSASAGRSEPHSGAPRGGVTVLNGSPAVSTLLHGSVSGVLDVPEGVWVEVRGVLEEAVVSGPGTVRVSGLIAQVLHAGTGEILASVGSVLAPAEAAGDWRVLAPGGTWLASPLPVFPDVPHLSTTAADPAGDLTWYPAPRD